MYYVDNFEEHCVEIKLKFLFLPRKCSISGNLLWLTLAYKKIAMYTGPGEPIIETRYYDRHEYLIAKICGKRI